MRSPILPPKCINFPKRFMRKREIQKTLQDSKRPKGLRLFDFFPNHTKFQNNHTKIQTILKILKRSFIWLQSGISSFIRLEMALKRVKHYHFQFCNPIEKWAFLQKRGSLWQALSPKRFEIQTWGWSRMKENSKIFKISWTKKV